MASAFGEDCEGRGDEVLRAPDAPRTSRSIVLHSARERTLNFVPLVDALERAEREGFEPSPGHRSGLLVTVASRRRLGLYIVMRLSTNAAWLAVV